MKQLLIYWCLILVAISSFSQEVNENVNNTGIYEFLDEMAGLKLISLNSAVKPYTRSLIAEKLVELRDAVFAEKYRFSMRQKLELQFYFEDYRMEMGRDAVITSPGLELLSSGNTTLALDYNPVGLHYRDSLFRLSLRPVLGAGFMTNVSGNGYQRYWGGLLMGYIGKNMGFFAELRDNNTSEPFSIPEYLNQVPGSVYKTRENGSVDYSEMRGGLTGSVKWGSAGILLDRVVWGDNYHGANILSGKIPSVPYLQLHLHPVKWFDFSYFHGWLNSNVVDSSRSYYTNGEYRIVYRNKFMAANMFTFIPWKGLNLSVGNSIVYSDQNLNPLYFIPFLFFNAVDAVKNNYDNDAGSNSQLFFNISSRNLRHVHLYVSLFIDEWKTQRLFDPELHNFTSLKVGFKVDDLWLRNVSLIAEYTRTQPMTYKHFIPSATFASNDFTMGHYLKDNSEEIFLQIAWRPYRGLMVSGSWTQAIRGEDIPYDYNAGYPVDQIPFIQNKTWQCNSLELTARFEYTSNGYFFMRYLHSEQTGLPGYQPLLFTGTRDTFCTGICIGL